MSHKFFVRESAILDFEAIYVKLNFRLRMVYQLIFLT